MDARQYDDERGEAGAFGAGAGKVTVRVSVHPKVVEPVWLLPGARLHCKVLQGGFCAAVQRRSPPSPAMRCARLHAFRGVIAASERPVGCQLCGGPDLLLRFALQATQLINHDGEVNRARYCPQNPHLLATKTIR